MRALVVIGLGLVLALSSVGCSKEEPIETRPLVGNRGAVGPAGARRRPGAAVPGGQQPSGQPGATK
jgi:hypothetical protein